jgi:imidazolonepropionase-like amidohydrolase
MKKLSDFSPFVSVRLFSCRQEKPTAFINARIIPIVGQPIEQGILLVQNGKITAVGDARTVRLSSDVQTN